MIPDDLREKLYQVMGFRSYGPADIYAVLKEWLEANDVEPPQRPK